MVQVAAHPSKVESGTSHSKIRISVHLGNSLHCRLIGTVPPFMLRFQRGEFLGSSKDRLLQKHLARVFSQPYLFPLAAVEQLT